MEVREFLRLVWKKSREDLFVVAFSILFMLTISYLSTLVFGWTKLIVGLPGVSGSPTAQRWLSDARDSDNDQLPDVMELTPKGEPVVVNGIKVAEGTGTDPFDADTDNDLFSDNAELKLGSDPHSWLDPGWVWVLWIIFFGALIFKLYIHKPDRLKEYRINEEMISRGVSGKGGRYAYGGGSIFSKPIEEMTEEEKREFLASDARVAELTGIEEDEPELELKDSWTGRIVRFIVVATIVFLLSLIF